jgi:predicted NAD/FAD-dependent oxidoreductase
MCLLRFAAFCDILQGLSKHGMKAVVFDTGEHSVGGRAATRSSADASLHAEWLSPSLVKAKHTLNLKFDHAAQCFTAKDPAFQQQVKAWEAAGGENIMLCDITSNNSGLLWQFFFHPAGVHV